MAPLFRVIYRNLNENAFYINRWKNKDSTFSRLLKVTRTPNYEHALMLWRYGTQENMSICNLGYIQYINNGLKMFCTCELSSLDKYLDGMNVLWSFQQWMLWKCISNVRDIEKVQINIQLCSSANTCQHTSLSANIFLPINTVYFCIMSKQSLALNIAEQHFFFLPQICSSSSFTF